MPYLVETMTYAENSTNRPAGIEPTIRAITIPADAKGNGDISGDWIMSQMDLDGGNAASVGPLRHFYQY